MTKTGIIISDSFEDFDNAVEMVRDLEPEADIYSPFPGNESKRVDGKSRAIPVSAAIGGFVGLFFGFWLQYWTSAIDYRLNLGGRPFFNWIYSIPVSFELAILCSVIFGFAAFLIKSNLPKWNLDSREDERGIEIALNDKFIMCFSINNTSLENKIVEKLSFNKNVELKIVEE